MKIGVLILGSLFKIGGYQVFAYNLMVRLSMRGQNVVLIVRSDEFRKNHEKIIMIFIKNCHFQ